MQHCGDSVGTAVRAAGGTDDARAGRYGDCGERGASSAVWGGRGAGFAARAVFGTWGGSGTRPVPGADADAGADVAADGEPRGIGRRRRDANAALRGENLSAICINNTTYGMTGGQLGPTTLLGQVTTTSPTGRNVEYYGYPIKIAEHVALCDGCAYSARVSLDSIANIRKAKQAIKKAFEVQIQGLGFGFVEILSTCPTNWKMTPEQAHARVRNEMMPVFKPGVYKDVTVQE